MTLIIPYQFTAGTKAQSAQVNADFQAVATEVNSIGSNVADIEVDITTLTNNKADVNGSSTNRFAVANPVNGYDAVNKQTFTSLCKYIMGGLKISKGGDDTIACTAGAGYDTTATKILILSSDTSKTNDSQVASATYYVYLVGQSTGTGTDLLISTSSANPPLPTDYDLYLPLGYYTTNSDNKVQTVYGYSYATNADISDTYSTTLWSIMPDWSKKVNRGTTYTLTEDCWVYLVATVGWSATSSSSKAGDVCIGGGLGRTDSTMRVGGIWIGATGDTITGSFTIFTVPFRGREL